ncbi:hypothetical protein EAF04_003866 [Stromatinia cepivora]|nr:hypothetical protein EAF04_003866 [Stromatinia cepivora]
MLVALSHVFGKAGVGLPIPGVLAYDSTFENALVRPYIMQEEVEGTTLLMQYRTMNRSLLDQRGPNHNPHLLKRRELARQIAGFIAKKEKHTFSGYGVLRNASDMNSWDPEVRAARYALGVAPTRIAGKLIPTSLDLSKFINDLACARLLKASSTLDVRAIKNARKLLDIWECMSERGLLTDEPSILWHPDFHPRNILFNNTVLTGVIDWDNSMALPRIMTREPPSFLWQNDPVLLSQPESNAVKDAFDDTIERLLPGYKEDAYSIYRVLIRALGMYTLFGVDYKHYHEFSWERLVRECDILFPEQGWELDRPFFH